MKTLALLLLTLLAIGYVQSWSHKRFRRKSFRSRQLSHSKRHHRKHHRNHHNKTKKYYKTYGSNWKFASYRRSRKDRKNTPKVNTTSDQGTSGGPQYDFYKFAKEWSGSTCYETSCDFDNLKKNQWNQHGLWPNQWKTYNIPGCSKEPWDPSKFTATQKSELLSFWNGMYNSNEGFWSHEWSKHGTCWSPNKGDLSKMPPPLRAHVQKARIDSDNKKSLETDYFHTVFLAQQPFDFYQILAKENITPSDTDTYSYDDILKAFQKGFGITHMDILCKKKDGESLLNEVRICLDLDYNVMDCPKGSRTCANDVSYPPHEVN